MDVQNLQIILEFDLSKLFSDLKKVHTALDKLEARIHQIPDVNIGAHFDLNHEEEQRFLRRLEALEQRAHMDIDAGLQLTEASRAQFLSEIRGMEGLRPTIDAHINLDRGELQRALAESEFQSVDLPTDFDYEASLTALRGHVRALESRRVNIPVDFETRSRSLTRVLSIRQSLQRNAVNIPVEFSADDSYGNRLNSILSDLRDNDIEIPTKFAMDEQSLAQIAARRQAQERNAITIPVKFDADESYGSRLDRLLGDLRDNDVEIPTKFKMDQQSIDIVGARRTAQQRHEVEIPVEFNVSEASLAKLAALRRNLSSQPIDIPVHFDADSDFGTALLNGDLDANKLNVDLSSKSMRAMADGAGRADRGGQAQSRSSKFRAPDKGLLTSSRETEGILDAFNIRAADIHNVMARLLPLMWTFIMTLPAAIAGLTTLATAALGAAGSLGAIAGLGFLGMASQQGGGGMPTMEAMGDILKGLLEDLWTAFEPLANRLAPLFERAVDAADVFFMRIAQGFEVLTDFRPLAVDFGRWMMDALPMIIENVIRLGTIFGDVFKAISNYVDGEAVFARMAETMGQMLPYLAQIGKVIYDMLPALTNLSIGFMKVTSIMFTMLSPLIDLLNRYPALARGLGMVAGMAMTLTTVLALLNTRIITLAITAIPRLGMAVIAMGASMLSGAGASAALSTGLTTLRTASLTAASGVTVLRAALIGLLATTGIGLLLVGVGALASKWIETKSNIDGATEALKNFENQQKGMANGATPYDAPTAPDNMTQTGPTRLGPTGGQTTTHLHGGRSQEDLDRVANKQAFVNRRSAGK